MAHTSGPRSSLERVYLALDARGLRPTRRAVDFHALCPVHEDRTQSLHVTWKDHVDGGRVVVTCFGCGAGFRDVCAAIGLQPSDLFDVPLELEDSGQSARPLSSHRVGRSPRSRREGRRRGRLGPLPARIVVVPPADAEAGAQHEHAWVPVETYTYVDVAGTVVQEVRRRRCEGCGGKDFRQAYVTAAGQLVHAQPDGFAPCLYRAPKVAEAVAAGQPIWLVEGEKDVHAAEAAGVVATTNPQGGRAFPPVLAEALAGARVFVVLDRDSTGYARGVQLHRLLEQVHAQVRLLLPAVTTAKADLSDHLEAGHGLNDLQVVTEPEVAAWAAVAGVTTNARLVETAADEAAAQLEQYTSKQPQAPKAAEQHRTNALRWVHETQVRWEQLVDGLDDVRRLYATAPTSWAAAAVEEAEVLARAARIAAENAHEAVGEPLPASLQRDRGDAARSDAGWSAQSVTRSAADAVSQPTSQLPSQGQGQATVAPLPSSAPDTSAAGGGQLVQGPWGGAGRGGDAGGPGGGRGGGGDGGAGGGGGARRPVPPPIKAPEYKVIDGKIVKVTLRQQRGADDGMAVEEYQQLINLPLRLERREYLDEDTDDDTAELLHGLPDRDDRQDRTAVAPVRAQSHVVFAYEHPVTRETMRVRVASDKATDSSWLHNLDVPGLSFDSTSRGRSAIWDAVRQLSPDSRSTTLYRGTGWRRDPEHGWIYVHADGAVGANGYVDVPSLLTGPLSRYNLPDPTEDADRLRSAFYDDAATMLDRFPERIGSVLLGTAWRAGLGANPYSTVLVGSPGTMKTAAAALTMHFFGEGHDRKKPLSSMSGEGDTTNALRLALHQAKDALALLDDVAPGKNLMAAQDRLERVLRMVHNQEARARNTRDGQDRTPGTPPRSSAIITSEVLPAPGSAAERGFMVPLSRGDIALADVVTMDALTSRHSRALLQASMFQWLAGDLPTHRARAKDAVGEYQHRLIQTGETIRQAEALGHLWAGWFTMTSFLTDVGALHPAEQRDLLERVDKALRVAAEATVDPDLPASTGARITELLGYALSSGIAYAPDARTGEAPPQYASQVGYRPSPTFTGGDSSLAPMRPEPRALRLGYVRPTERGSMAAPGGDELICDPNMLDAVLKAASSTVAEGLDIDRPTAQRALHEEGVLIKAREGARERWTHERTLPCLGTDSATGKPVRRRMLVLRLDRLLRNLGTPPPDPTSPSPQGQGGSGAPPAEPGGASDPGSRDGAPADGRTAGSLDELLESPLADGGDTQPRGADHNSGSDGGLAENRSQSYDQGRTESRDQDVDTDPEDAQEGDMPMSAPDNEEDRLRRRLPDRDGLVGEYRVSSDAATPCLICRRSCSVWFGSLVLHVPCWQNSTAAQRAALAGATAHDGPQAMATRPVGPARTNTPPCPAPAQPGAGAGAGTPSSPTPTPTPTPSPTAVGVAHAPAPAGATASSTASGTASFRAAAAVADLEGIWLPDGERHRLPTRPHLGALAELVHELNLGVQVTPRYSLPGQLWVMPDLAAAWGWPVLENLPSREKEREQALREWSSSAPALKDAEAAGWQLGSGGVLKGWLRVWRAAATAGADGRGVVLVHAGVLNPDSPVLTGLGEGHLTGRILSRRLQRFADAAGTSWHYSAGHTGVDLLKSLRWLRREEMFTVVEPVAPAQLPNVEAEASWSRRPTEEEQACRYLHAYDYSGAYLAGAASLEVGLGAPEHRLDDVAFDAKLPGYWRVRVPDAADWRLPHPLAPVLAEAPIGGARGVGEARWFTTPTLQVAQEFGYELEVLEAHVWPDKARVFDPWYQRLRDARSAAQRLEDDPAVLAMVKDVYAHTVGRLAAGYLDPQVLRAASQPEEPMYRPDWRHLVIAKARANRLRKLRKIGVEADQWPLAYTTDTVVYASNNPDPVSAWPGAPQDLGTALGKWKPYGSAMLAEHLPLLNGGRYEGLRELTKLALWTPASTSPAGDD
jgi:hypothetical protein